MKVSADTWNGRINKLLLSRLDERIDFLYRQGWYAEAVRAAEQALKVAGETFSPDHPQVVACQNNLALMNKMRENQAALGEDRWNCPEDYSGAVKSRLSKPGAKFVGILLLVCLLSAGFVGGYTTLTADQFQPVYASPARSGSRPYYLVKASFDPRQRVITGREEVILENREPVPEIIFNLYFNRYKDKALDTSEIRRYALARGNDQGFIEILQVACQGKPVPFQQEGEILRISHPNGLFSPGEHVLQLDFKVKIPYLADRAGGNQRGIRLGNWLPTLSVDGRRYQSTEIGDPFLNFSATYEVVFTVPKEYTLVLSNLDRVREQGRTRIYHGVLERVRDLPVFLTSGYQKAETTAGKTRICYYYLDSDSRAGQVLAAARQAVAYFQNRIGEYPWEQLNIVETDMYLNGMEYSTLFLISPKALRENLAETVFHEAGHQWFYNIVGSDQYNAPFIDEGLVEYFTSCALRRNLPGYAANLGLQRNLGRFESWPEYRDVHYRNGRRLFESLSVLLGKNEFEKFIKEYYDRYKFGFVSGDEFRLLLNEKIGERSAQELLN